MELVNVLENEHLSMLNHSCAHMMAQAVKRLYPNAKFWVGPVISEGFYYDMDLGDVSSDASLFSEAIKYWSNGFLLTSSFRV